MKIDNLSETDIRECIQEAKMMGLETIVMYSDSVKSVKGYFCKSRLVTWDGSRTLNEITIEI